VSDVLLIISANYSVALNAHFAV